MTKLSLEHKELMREIKLLFADDNETNFEVEDNKELLELLKKKKREMYETKKQLEHLQQGLSGLETYPLSYQRIESWRNILNSREVQDRIQGTRSHKWCGPDLVIMRMEGVLQSFFSNYKAINKLEIVKKKLTNWIKLLTR